MSRKSKSVLGTKDDSNLEMKRAKVEESSSLSVTVDTLVNKSFHFVVNNVGENIRFTPEIIEFIDAFEGKQFSEKITIKNVGRNPVSVKIGEPNSFIFQLKKPIRRAKLLPSGCSITRTVTYTYHSDDLVACSQIPIHINGRSLCVPIIVKKARPHIEVEPRTLDFKVVNVGAKPRKMTFTILNKGGKRTKFEIDFKKNFLDLVVNPIKGIVKAKDLVNVTVEVMGLTEGEYYQELWIKTAELPIRVPVMVEIVRPHLEITYPNGTEELFVTTYPNEPEGLALITYPNGTEELTLITFPPAFIGTQKLGSFIFKNFSVEDTLFIILAEINGKLETLKNAKSSVTAFKMFTLTAEEGYLKPFEDRIINVTFCPLVEEKTKGWYHEECKIKNETQNKYIVFFRIIRVHCLGPEELKKIESKCNDNLKGKEDVHSLADYKFTSEEKLENFLTNSEQDVDYLRLCFLGEAIEPDILIQPMSFEFDDLMLNQTENRVLKITNNSAIAVKCKLCKAFNVKVTPSEVWLKSEKAQEFLVSLTPTSAGSFKTKMVVQILAESDMCKNKTLEMIAVYTVIFTYNANDVPSVLLPKVGLGITPMMTDEVGLHKDLITFKDAFKYPYAAMLGLKQGFRPAWMRMEEDQINNVDNAIIALPNDRPRLFYTWPKEKTCRAIFTGFFRYSPPEDLTYTLSPDGRIERKERRAIWTDFISVLRELRLNKLPRPKELDLYLEYEMSCKKGHRVEVFQRSRTRNPNTCKSLVKRCERFPSNTFVPLSPLLLYNVIVEPKLISFETVPIGTTAKETITVNNKNPFPISVRLLAEKSSLTVMEEGLVVVQPSSSKSIPILFETNILGRYLGFLKYIINESHVFKISITANVIPTPASKISAEDIPQGDEKDPCSSMTGFLTGRSSDLMKMTGKKLGVEFITNQINICDISINYPTKISTSVRNAYYYDVCFEVICTMPGVTIEPQRGTIYARSVCPLDIKIQIPVLIKFTFEIVLIVNLVENVSLKLTGNVVLPDIRLRPSEVVMRKICAHSFETFAICVENAGNTPAEVEIDFKNWPEFRLPEDQSKFYLPPKKASKIVIHFEPIDMARYVFYLPIIINDLLGPPMIQQRATEYVNFYTSDFEKTYESFGNLFNTETSKLKIPFICINSTVYQSLIRLSSRHIDFVKEFNMETGPQTIEIFNDFTDIVTFCIRNDDLGEFNDSPFDLVPVVPGSVEYRLKSIKAHIRHGEKLLFKATFNPKKPGFYSVDVPIFVRGYSNGLVYNYIHLRGTFKPPLITPEVSEIHFPPLPLGVGCDATFSVLLENYNTPDIINCLVWDPLTEENNSEQKCLTTTWLNEPKVAPPRATYLFRLRVQFQSFVPTALRNYILLFDSMGVYATVLVTAVADNSSVSDHAFLSLKASAYKLVRSEPLALEWRTDESIYEYPVKKYDLKLQSDAIKMPKKIRSKSIEIKSSDNSKHFSSSGSGNATNNACSLPIDKGPRLVIQMTKSMTRPTDLKYVKIAKKFTDWESKSSSSTVLAAVRSDVLSYVTDQSSKMSKMPFLPNTNSNLKRKDSTNDNTYPYFPAHDNENRKYFQETLTYVERWIFEVVMRCDQYLSIPRSFQRLKEPIIASKTPGNKQNVEKEPEKDFLDFLFEIIERDRNIPERPTLDPADPPIEKAKIMKLFFGKILQFLESKGCLLPHVKPEYLMNYENYSTYFQSCENSEYFSWKNQEIRKFNSVKISLDPITEKEESYKKFSQDFSNDSSKESFFDDFFNAWPRDVEKPEERNADNMELHKQQTDHSAHNHSTERHFEHKIEILDKVAFDSRSTQAWFDIVIQVFRVFVLSKIVSKPTIPEVLVVEKSDKILPEIINISTVLNYNKMPKGQKILPAVDSLSSNIYSIQERILLAWLNHHLHVQKEILWKSRDECLFRGKVLNNFDKDLSDSVALIAVTASHCPYIVTDYFKDVYPKPDTLVQVRHNAAKLIEAWNTLALGFSIKISEIMKPNPVFMVMLVAYLYEFLPSLHPHSLICFSAPLNSETTRTLLLKNDSHERILYKARFFGGFEDLFQLADQHIVELRHSKVTNLNVKFNVKKIRKISTILFLNTLSPNFAKHVTFYLEGEPSQFPEHEKFTFIAPLYKVICAEVPINSPYSEAGCYEIWYTTKQPEYSPMVNTETLFKPWSKIWSRKVSRRLFLNTFKMVIQQSGTQDILSVTIACFTNQKRLFWLLFHSAKNDFIILIEIKPKLLEFPSLTADFCSRGWSPSASCTCLPENMLKGNSNNCPFFTNLMIPKRNAALWQALRTMFFKSLNPKEISFWAEHFEMNNGLFLILWLLNPEEEKEVIDEFIQVLSTKVTYSLNLESTGDYVAYPLKIEIPDVRETNDIAVPIHISKNAPLPLTLKLTMTSENEKEIRVLKVTLQPPDSDRCTAVVVEDSTISDSMCQPFFLGETLKPCKSKKKK